VLCKPKPTLIFKNWSCAYRCAQWYAHHTWAVLKDECWFTFRLTFVCLFKFSISCVLFWLSLGYSVLVLFAFVVLGLVFFGTTSRDWLRWTFPKWPILCRVRLAIKGSQVRLLAVPLSGNNLRQVVHTRVSVTKQYKLAKGRWCRTHGKLTVGLASHWPCVTDFSGLSSYGLNGLRKGQKYPAYTSLRSVVPSTFTSYIAHGPHIIRVKAPPLQ